MSTDMSFRGSFKKLNWRTLIIVAAGVVEMFLLLLGGIKMLEFTDSAQFCGQLCHTPMTPEFKTFTVSPHSRVQCATCHVGSGASYFVKSKVSGVPLFIATTFNTFPRPITTPVRDLRPARDTCEQCHWPQKFSEDRLKKYLRYVPDEANTKDEFQLAFRVGSGEPRTARDIHWHVASKIWYLPLDARNQAIAWLEVEAPGGGKTQYFDPGRIDQVTREKIESGKKFMDCIDCHNRATHIFRSPDYLVDQAINQGRIDATLPFIKRLSVEALDVSNPSLEVTRSKIASLSRYYQEDYPAVYAQKKVAIEQAQAVLTDLTQYVVFPEMQVSWETHTNNLTHTGCFRCHGKLTAKPSEAKPIPISSACDACHYSVPATTPSPPPSLTSRPSPTPGPTVATPLGTTATPGAPKPIPANHAGRTTCFACHVSGVGPKLPTSLPHASFADSLAICQACHKGP